jgi:Sortase domain
MLKLNNIVRSNKNLRLQALAIAMFAVGIIGVNVLMPKIGGQHYLNPGTVAAAGKSIRVSAAVSPMPSSLPTRLIIPKIGVNAPVIQLGLNRDGTLATPYSPVEVGWYKNSPAPGGNGSSIIVGHVDYINYGPAVFWNLNKLGPGDSIDVDRADGSVADFKVNSVTEYPQNNFPSKEVYGNVSYPSLRLITCGGVWNNATRHYSDNTVIYATLVN